MKSKCVRSDIVTVVVSLAWNEYFLKMNVESREKVVNCVLVWFESQP